MTVARGKTKSVFMGVVLFVIVVGVWSLSWCLIVGSPVLTNWADRAAFGEMFWAVGGLFTGLAFAGVILTLYLQTSELGLQRKSLEQSSDQLEALTTAQRAGELAICQLARAQALAGLARINTSTPQMRKAEGLDQTRGDLEDLLAELGHQIAVLKTPASE
jgi:hypothetical protein